MTVSSSAPCFFSKSFIRGKNTGTSNAKPLKIGFFDMIFWPEFDPVGTIHHKKIKIHHVRCRIIRWVEMICHIHIMDIPIPL